MTARKSRQIGLFAFLGVIIALLCWDAVMQFVFGLKHTVSWAVWQASTSAPITVAIPCMIVGALFGHLYWSGYADAQKEKKIFLDALEQIRKIVWDGDPAGFTADEVDDVISQVVRATSDD